MSFANASLILQELCLKRCYDLVFTDDTPWRIELLLLARAFGVPSVVSTHTDITHMKSFKGPVKVVWYVHMLSTYLAAVHATVSRIFGDQLRRQYGVPLGAVWPPILWSSEFKSEPEDWLEQAAAQRKEWLDELHEQGCHPKAILLSAGRWSAEKRINLLIEAVPKDCALVIVGDGTSEFAEKVANSGPPSGRPNILPRRKMLNGPELRKAYAACDLFLSASNFETLGNTIIEAMCSGKPCAVQPAQGHLEFVKDGINSYFVDYDDSEEARSSLSRIVASGLDDTSLKKALPELAVMGSQFRSGNFARNFQDTVITPALAVGKQQSGFIEGLKRIACFLTCVLMWFILRFFLRLGFVTLRDPEFEVLGPLGSAHDDKKSPAVSAYPCLRLFSACRRYEESEEVADVSDWATHFESARKPWWNKRL
jgi:glycosyltransferase involved in cell wall biosynthesis